MSDPSLGRPILDFLCSILQPWARVLPGVRLCRLNLGRSLKCSVRLWIPWIPWSLDMIPMPVVGGQWQDQMYCGCTPCTPCYDIARMISIFYERGTLVCFMAQNGGGQTFAEALFDLALHGDLGARPQLCGWHQWPYGDAMWPFKRWLKTFHANVNVADLIWLTLSLFASLFAAYWAIGRHVKQLLALAQLGFDMSSFV